MLRRALLATVVLTGSALGVTLLLAPASARRIASVSRLTAALPQAAAIPRLTAAPPGVLAPAPGGLAPTPRPTLSPALANLLRRLFPPQVARPAPSARRLPMPSPSIKGFSCEVASGGCSPVPCDTFAAQAAPVLLQSQVQVGPSLGPRPASSPSCRKPSVSRTVSLAP
jgi:hypothetical protein